MQLLDGQLVHSASDLNAYIECRHLLDLEREHAAGRIVRPKQTNRTAELLARKGDAHEQHHLARLRTQYGERLVAFAERPVQSRAGYAAAERDSIAAMERGAAVIYQATFFDGTFLGRADFLQRVERPSQRWPWSYEVVDTKLALSPKPYFLMQLCNYSEHVERIQGSAPVGASIVLGSGARRTFRIEEYAAFYRHVKHAYLASVSEPNHEYPVECAHCDLCVWRPACARKRDDDDHLSLVAGVRRDQIRKLQEADIGTLAALATAPSEPPPRRLNGETFDNLRAQAREQHKYRAAQRATGNALHSYTFRNPAKEQAGLARLPAPDPGDIFFDMEGDPLYSPERGLEYLFGVYLPHEDVYRPFWGTTPADERIAFEGFVDFVVARQLRYPQLHVYHYAPYETTALKRLMGRFASRENTIDGFLRAQTFVDLYPVVKQSVWISQPSYSIKKLEALYGFTRQTQTLAGDDSIVTFESWLESQDPEALEDIQAYNEDDCKSTFLLRQWLLGLRAERNATLSVPAAWRVVDAPAERAEEPQRTDLERRLLDGVTEPDSLTELRALSAPLRARWLLGNLLEYHRREQKPEWWEYFNRLEHPTDFIDGDRKALGGLQLCAAVAPYKSSPRDRNLVYTYDFPDQDYDIGDDPHDVATGKSAGTIVRIDDRRRRLEIKLSNRIDPAGLRALIPGPPLAVNAHRDAIAFIAQEFADGTLAQTYPATLGLLEGSIPRLRDRPAGAPIQPTPVRSQAVSAIVECLDHSYLVVQGPPGTGKSTLGAQVIVDLLAAGKRVALAAQSHKALHNLLRKIEQTAVARGVRLAGCHKSTDVNPDSAYVSNLETALITSSPNLAGAAGCALVSATTFSWAKSPTQRGAFDVVVIDEAGQISLADALVTSLLARNVVLLGDPQQLPQVSQGSHPVGTERSILEHLLDGQSTIPVNRGIFLDRSYRLQPQIDRFVSDAFYDGRLQPDPLNANNAVTVGGAIWAGTRYLSVEHEGNARRSIEEADCIVEEIAALLAGGTVTIRDGAPRRIAVADILVVAPYNAQRLKIIEQLEHRGIVGIAVGTVDKFQGQEAPIVFYSMTTSSAELAPRGLEFLLSPNRLNVAVSRAQALSVLVCSASLLASRVSTIEQMRQLNLLCAYVETSQSERLPTPVCA